MRGMEFVCEKIMLLILHFFSALALVFFLKVMGMSNGVVLVIILSWIFILGSYLTYEFYQVKRKYSEMLKILEELDQKYLICEVLKKPSTQMEKVTLQLLREATKSMTEEVGKAREGQCSYKEYIEKWIHEIKTPITAIQLICNNHKTEETDRIGVELKRIYYLVEQTLYYARSETVEQDYFIKEIRLFDIVQQVILQHRTVLIENHITLEVNEREDVVWTDEKWLYYIIGQIMNNAIKYHAEKEAKVHIFSERSQQGISLIIEDNGAGIAEGDLPRIFEKGFTGTNRSNKQSTGLGLYLCKKLCDKLGLKISAESEKGHYTRITLFFPIGKLTAGVSKVLTKL